MRKIYITMKTRVRKIFIIIICALLFTEVKAQEALDGNYPLDLNKTILIVEQFDSIGKQCDGAGDKKIYCDALAKETDKNLELYQQKQAEIFKEYNFEYVIVSPKEFPYREYSEFSDIEKYRYVLKKVSMAN